VKTELVSIQVTLICTAIGPPPAPALITHAPAISLARCNCKRELHIQFEGRFDPSHLDNSRSSRQSTRHRPPRHTTSAPNPKRKSTKPEKTGPGPARSLDIRGQIGVRPNTVRVMRSVDATDAGWLTRNATMDRRSVGELQRHVGLRIQDLYECRP
jgi:hypothetical protein